MSKYVCYGLGVALLSLLLSASTSAATLARQCGAFGIVIYDPAPEPAEGYVARQCGAFGIVTYDLAPEPADGYAAWATANGVSGAWNATDANGIHNVFRYAFNKPTGAFTEPPLLDIAFNAAGKAVIITPPLVNSAGFTFTIEASDSAAGTGNTASYGLSASGETVIDETGKTTRFFRLKAVEQ